MMKWEVPGYYWCRGRVRVRSRAALGRSSRREGGVEVVLLGHPPHLALRGHLCPLGATAQARRRQLREEVGRGGLPRHGPDARRLRAGYPPAHLGKTFWVSHVRTNTGLTAGV